MCAQEFVKVRAPVLVNKCEESVKMPGRASDTVEEPTLGRSSRKRKQPSRFSSIFSGFEASGTEMNNVPESYAEILNRDDKLI